MNAWLKSNDNLYIVIYTPDRIVSVKNDQYQQYRAFNPNLIVIATFLNKQCFEGDKCRSLNGGDGLMVGSLQTLFASWALQNFSRIVSQLHKLHALCLQY